MRLIKTQTPVDFTLQTAGHSPAGPSRPGDGDGIMRWFLPNFKYSISPTEQGAAPAVCRSLAQTVCPLVLILPGASSVCSRVPTCLGVQSPSVPSTGHQDSLGVLHRTRFPPSAVRGPAAVRRWKPDRGRADSRSGPTTLSFRCCAPWRQLSRRSCPQTSALLPLFSVS